MVAHHSKGNKQVRLVERKVCFISEQQPWARVADICPKARSLPLTNRLYRQKEGLHADTAWSALGVILVV